LDEVSGGVMPGSVLNRLELAEHDAGQDRRFLVGLAKNMGESPGLPEFRAGTAEAIELGGHPLT
jgi:hypothetical protein